MSAGSLPPVGFQQSEISAALNSTMLTTFLMGIYTIIYFGTLYLYLTRKSSQKRIVLGTITVLYTLGVIQLGIQWWFLQRTFVENGETQATTFIALNDVPLWSGITVNVMSFSMYTLADGLLLWRCFYVWNRSPWVISIPVFLFIAEIGLYICAITFQCIGGVNPTEKQAVLLDATQSAAFFVSFATSLLTTLLIAYKIYAVCREDSYGSSLRNFKHIIEALVQSAATYSIMLLVNAVAVVLPLDSNVSSTNVFALGNYSGALLLPIAGIAPTVMVARVVFASVTGENMHMSTTRHLSGLEFKTRSTMAHSRDTDLGSETIRSQTKKNSVDENIEK